VGRQHLRTQAAAEKEVTAVAGHRVSDFGTGLESSDFDEGPGEAFRIPGELNGGSIGEVFPLPGNGGLDEIAEKAPDVADREESDAGGQHDESGPGTFFPVRLESAANAESQDQFSHEGEKKDPVKQRHKPNIQPHVAIEDVGKFVSDDSLKFIAGEKGHASASDPDDGIARGFPRRKGIDRVLAVHHEYGRNGDSGGDRHFLDHIHEAALVEVGRVQVDLAAAELAGDNGTTAGKLRGFKRTREKDDERGAHAGVEEYFRSPERVSGR